MDIVANKEKNGEYRKRAAELVAQMTLEEKVSQTLNWAPGIERLGIKKYNWWNEALHGVARAGVATVFPQAIGLAATFDEDFMEEVADAISTEGRAKFNMEQASDDNDIYKGLTFWSPNVNIFRDPRWGRGHETFGEDPYLTSRLAVRFIQGLQGHDENYLKAAACAKHFAVHSGPEGIRHSFDAVVSKQDMRETYLPAFKACVQEAKVEAVMGAYNRTNGKPCCGHKELLQDILREEWGFEGHVVSDCWAIKDFHEGHMVTKTPVESVSLAMNNGCDLNCGNLFHYLKQAVEEGKVSEARLDEALVNLFTTRMKLGVFDRLDDNKFNEIPYSVVDSKPMRELNRKAAEKCVVLLKNEGNLLPLDKSKLKTVGVIGPNANSRAALVGNYEGTASRYVTVLEGLQDYLGEEVRVMTSEGCHLCHDKVQGLGEVNDRLAEVRGVCKESDIVIACMGLDATLEGEEGDTGNEFASGDKPNLNLPGLQQQILEEIVACGKPVVLVMGGSSGAGVLNDLIGRAAAKLTEKYEVVHLCGRQQADLCRPRPGYFVMKYAGEELRHLYAMADLVVSRALTAVLKGERPSLHGDALADAAMRSSDCERAAVDAERAADKLMMARFMHGHVGELFDGVVSGVSEWGVYVALENGAEGFMHVRSLDDWFDFDERRMTLRGERTGYVFSLGLALSVRVESVELESSTIDLSLAEPLQPRKKEKSARKKERERMRSFSRM